MRVRLASSIPLMLAGAATLSACASGPRPVSRTAARPVPAAPPAGMQYLYGSGEAGALSVQAYNMLTAYARAKVKARPADSVVLADGAPLDAPAFTPCGAKPFAAVFDVDETLVANLGFEYDDALSGRGFDAGRWDRWEKTGADKVSAIPGAVDAVNALRTLGVTVIFNTNRSAANADAAVQAIANAGLGKAVHGETLFLSGDDSMGSRKDGRRATIAARYCVIAMGGDQLGDFTDAFNRMTSVTARRQAALSGPIAALWGNGWFVLPNPVYGTGLEGGYDDIFPTDRRWVDPTEKEMH